MKMYMDIVGTASFIMCQQVDDTLFLTDNIDNINLIHTIVLMLHQFNINPPDTDTLTGLHFQNNKQPFAGKYVPSIATCF